MIRRTAAVSIGACLVLAGCSNGPVPHRSGAPVSSAAVASSRAATTAPAPTYSASVIPTPGVAANDYEACFRLFDPEQDTVFGVGVVDSVILTTTLTNGTLSTDVVASYVSELQRAAGLALDDLRVPLTRMISDLQRGAHGSQVVVARLRDERAGMATICGAYPGVVRFTP